MVSKGFTLIEILLVVAILAITTAVVVPMFASGHITVQISAASRTVMSDLMFIQNSAITQQRRMFVYSINDPSGVRAYTVASFIPPLPNPLPTPTWAQINTVGGNGGFAGEFLRHPISKRNYLQTFGPGAEGAFNRTRLHGFTANNANVTVFGFDDLGQPIGANGQPLLHPVLVRITNVAGDISTTLVISPLTGEISVQ